MLLYSARIYLLTGDPLTWIVAHAPNGRVYRGPIDLVIDRIKYVEANGLYNYVTVLNFDVLNGLAAVLALASAWPVYRRFGLPYAALILATVLLPLLMGGTLSMGRVTAVLFPMFFWLAVAIPARQRGGWMMASAMMQAFCAIAFFVWNSVRA